MIYFIYKTTNLINGKIYIGMHSTNNIYDGYLGSGVAFKNAVRLYGKDNFSVEILEFTDSYDSLIELEKVYVNECVVNDRNTYNLKTGGQSSGLLSEESRIKISNTLKAKYDSGELTPRYSSPYELTDKQKKMISETLKERYKINLHHSVGVEPWNKDKVSVQVAWNKDIKTGPLEDKHKNKIGETMKKWHSENEHPLLGKDPWNKGKVGTQVAWNKDTKMPKMECYHCGKMVDKANGKRWHFDNCKNKLK